MWYYEKMVKQFLLKGNRADDDELQEKEGAIEWNWGALSVLVLVRWQ